MTDAYYINRALEKRIVCDSLNEEKLRIKMFNFSCSYIEDKETLEIGVTIDSTSSGATNKKWKYIVFDLVDQKEKTIISDKIYGGDNMNKEFLATTFIFRSIKDPINTIKEIRINIISN